MPRLLFVPLVRLDPVVVRINGAKGKPWVAVLICVSLSAFPTVIAGTGVVAPVVSEVVSDSVVGVTVDPILVGVIVDPITVWVVVGPAVLAAVTGSFDVPPDSGELAEPGSERGDLELDVGVALGGGHPVELLSESVTLVLGRVGVDAKLLHEKLVPLCLALTSVRELIEFLQRCEVFGTRHNSPSFVMGCDYLSIIA